MIKARFLFIYTLAIVLAPLGLLGMILCILKVNKCTSVSCEVMSMELCAVEGS